MKLPKGYSYDTENKRFICRFTFERHRYAVYGATQAECEEKRIQMMNQLMERGHIDNSKITLRQYYLSWLEEQEKSVKPSTIYNYQKSWTHVEKCLGSLPVKSINKIDVQKLQRAVANKSSASAANRCVRLLKQILNSAIAEEIISRNPCLAVKNMKVETPKATDTNHRALTAAESKLFLDHSKRCHYHMLFRFLLASGCRIGEATALTWFDVNFSKNEISINKTISRISNTEFVVSDTPKTESSNRTLPITSELKEILLEQRERNTMLFGSRCMLVFPNNEGNLANYNGVGRSVRIVIDNINKSNDTPLQPFSVHAFRDTFATRCIEQGMNPQTLKALLGHSSLKMTMDLYAHVMPNTKLQELEKISFAV